MALTPMDRSPPPAGTQAFGLLTANGRDPLGANPRPIGKPRSTPSITPRYIGSNTTRRATPSRVPLVSSAAAFLDTDKRRFHAISPTRFASRHSGPGPRLPIALTLKCAVLPTAYPGLLVLLVAPPAAKALTSAACMLARSALCRIDPSMATLKLPNVLLA